MRPPRSRAFTLLEMVVVLAIIGVMASLRTAVLAVSTAPRDFK